MKLRLISLFLSLIMFCTVTNAAAEDTNDWISTALMESTFKLYGNDSLGTAFFIGKPVKGLANQAYYVLVTAAHVLQGISGETATIALRKRLNDGGWQRAEYTFQIRKNKQKLWVQHPTADVAVMYLTLPPEIKPPLLPIEILATDTILEKSDIHPGEQLLCLGYPLGDEANPIGFPIFRSGRLASYPIIPLRQVGSILFDFQVFAGNSGGPVFIMDRMRMIKGTPKVGSWQFILGLVSQQRLFKSKSETPFKKTEDVYPLGIAEVVASEFILETINLLPEQPLVK
ncbi:MAG: trypsin-like peptidase domain-containing protein [Desulfuromonadales bacterium]|nr:trypsin-like peptidase domain-containing protein [Desulfuromonadales bacterium]